MKAKADTGLPLHQLAREKIDGWHALFKFKHGSPHLACPCCALTASQPDVVVQMKPKYFDEKFVKVALLVAGGSKEMREDALDRLSSNEQLSDTLKVIRQHDDYTIATAHVKNGRSPPKIVCKYDVIFRNPWGVTIIKSSELYDLFFLTSQEFNSVCKDLSEIGSVDVRRLARDAIAVRRMFIDSAEIPENHIVLPKALGIVKIFARDPLLMKIFGVAYQSGYFEFPRRCTEGDIAIQLGSQGVDLSRQSVSRYLRIIWNEITPYIHQLIEDPQILDLAASIVLLEEG